MLARIDTVFRILSDLNEIEAAAEQWRALEERCTQPMAYFQTYDWCRNWLAEYVERGQHEAHVATLWRDEQLVALWPLMVAHGGGIRRLMTLGAPHSQYCGMLADPGLDSERELKPMMRQALGNSGCDVAVFRAVPEGGSLAQALGDMPWIEDAGDAASMLDLTAYASADDYTAQLGKLQKRNRNRRRNHLAREGELEFSVIWPDDPGFSALVMQCADWKRHWLAQMKIYSAGFAMAGFDHFLASLTGSGAAQSGACLSVLKVGGAPVAIELGFIRQGHYYAYMGAFDWERRDLSPGKVQMDFTVCWLIDQRIETYDLLTNSADYKKSWSSRSVAVRCHAKALTWKGQFFASVWLPRLRPAVKRLHARLPQINNKGMALLRSSLCLLLYV